jgi:hypothetical protein
LTIALLLLAIAGTDSLPQKNILLIIADDLGAGALSLYHSTANGAVLATRPNISSPASKGVVFVNPDSSPRRALVSFFRALTDERVAGAADFSR